MFVVDDLLLRAIGISIPPFDLLWILEIINDFVNKQRYNIEEINDKLKENRLLFELGEIKKETYEEAEKMLKKRLEEFKIVEQHISQTKEINLL